MGFFWLSNRWPSSMLLHSRDAPTATCRCHITRACAVDEKRSASRLLLLCCWKVAMCVLLCLLCLAMTSIVSLLSAAYHKTTMNKLDYMSAAAQLPRSA